MAVAPGDSFDGALVLANTSDQDMTAKLDVILPDSLELQGKLSPDVKIPPIGKLSCLSMLPCGQARSRRNPVRARNTRKTWRRKASLSVRPQSPLMTTVQSGWLEKSADLLCKPQDLPANGSPATLLSPPCPQPLARGFAEYLNAYPYGCTEQLVSKAFAQALPRIGPVLQATEESDKIIEAALGAIRSRFQRQRRRPVAR